MPDDNLRRSPFSMQSTRTLFISILILLFAHAVSAYTVVFRDGRRVEIPPVFTLTSTTLTYEVAPGFNETVQVSSIDIAATERANNEASGGFLKHAAQTQIDPSPPTRRAVKTLTNSDLEAIRQRRLESEKTYEKRRVELGLPSIEETRRRQALEEESTLALARQRATERANDEAYWRSRASEIRDQIIALDAQINYLNSRQASNGNVPQISYGQVTTVPYGYPTGPYGYPTGPYGYPTGYPTGPYGYPTGYPTGPYGYPTGYPTGPYGYPTGYPTGPYGYPTGYPSGPYGYPSGSYGYPWERLPLWQRRSQRNQGTVTAPRVGTPNRLQRTGAAPLSMRDPWTPSIGIQTSPYLFPSQPLAYGNSYAADTNGKLDDVLMKRAALEALWGELENEARKARVPQVWLLAR